MVSDVSTEFPLELLVICQVQRKYIGLSYLCMMHNAIEEVVKEAGFVSLRYKLR